MARGKRGDVTVKFGADTQAFTKGLDNVTGKLQKLGKHKFGGAAMGALKGTIFVAGAAGLARFVKGTLNSVDALGKLSTKLGMSTEFISEMQYAAELSGIKNNELAMSLQRVNRRFGEIQAGGGKAYIETLRTLNPEILKTVQNGGDITDVIGELADAFNNELIPASVKTRLAFSLFDSEGVKMLQLMDHGSDGIAKMRKEARALGVSFDEAMTKKAATANTAFIILKSSLSAMWEQFAIDAASMIVTTEPGKASRQTGSGTVGTARGADPRAIEQARRDEIARKEAIVAERSRAAWAEHDKWKKTGGVELPPGWVQPGEAGPDIPWDVAAPSDGPPTQSEYLSGIEDPEERARKEQEFAQLSMTAWEEHFSTVGGHLEAWQMSFADANAIIFEDLAQGMGDSVANAILLGESMAENMRRLMSQVAGFVISELTKMLIKKVLLDRIAAASERKKSLASVHQTVGQVFSKTWSWWSDIFPPIAPVMAALAAGAALAGSLAYFAEGGIVTGATLGILGEAGPEAVIPLDRLGEFGGETTIIIELDGRVIAQAAVENMPGVLRLQGLG